MTDDFYVRTSKCPVVKTDRVKLLRIMDITGLGGPYGALRFEYDIHWLRESTAAAVLRTTDNDVIKEQAGYTDYYGFLTSYQGDHEPLAMAKNWAKTRKLTPESSIIAEAIVTIADEPVVRPSDSIINRSSAGQLYPKAFLYVAIPNDWMLDNERAAARIAGWNDPQAEFTIYEVDRLETSNPIRHVIWSSANTDEENARAILELEQYRPQAAMKETA